MPTKLALPCAFKMCRLFCFFNLQQLFLVLNRHGVLQLWLCELKTVALNVSSVSP